jgi:hypothetical protein
MLLTLVAAGALFAPQAAVAAPTGSAGVATAAAKKPALSATLQTCSVGDRSAAFRGTMPALGRRGRLEMRFDLFQRPKGRRAFARVPNVVGFGSWTQSAPGVSGLIVTKRVSGLQGGTAYRALVRYRWRNAKGKVVRTASRVTPACRQGSAAPNLVLRDPAILPGTRGDGALTYRVSVRNAGRAASGAADVVLRIGQVDQPAQRIGPLAPGETVLVTFQGPRCGAGQRLRVSVDARGEVAESSEADNVLERRCVLPR